MWDRSDNEKYSNPTTQWHGEQLTVVFNIIIFFLRFIWSKLSIAEFEDDCVLHSLLIVALHSFLKIYSMNILADNYW